MPSTPATEIIEELRRGIDNVLSASVLGAYIFGSYVLGDFDERLSDIDLLVVSRFPITDVEFGALYEMHSNLVARYPIWDNRVEVVYVDETTLRTFRDGGDVIRISPGEPFHRTAFLPHWLMDLYTVQERGLTILGAEANGVLPRISEGEFKRSISQTVQEWLDWMRGTLQERYLAYIRLALCRSLFAFRSGEQTSKSAAARWVAQEYPDWAVVASEAVLWRQLNSESENEAGLIRTEEFGWFVFGATRTETSSTLTQSRHGVGTAEENTATTEA